MAGMINIVLMLAAWPCLLFFSCLFFHNIDAKWKASPLSSLSPFMEVIWNIIFFFLWHPDDISSLIPILASLIDIPEPFPSRVETTVLSCIFPEVYNQNCAGRRLDERTCIPSQFHTYCISQARSSLQNRVSAIQALLKTVFMFGGQKIV